MAFNLTIFYFILLLCSIPILGGGIWLAYQSFEDCVSNAAIPVSTIVVLLLVASVAGLLGTCCRIVSLLWFYLFVIFCLIFIILGFSVFASVATHKIDDSSWLRKMVENSNNWDNIKACLADGKPCDVGLLAEKNITSSQFLAIKLSPIQAGCCSSSRTCNYQYVRPTVWSKTSRTDFFSRECTTWSNNPKVLCYNCQSCKTGVVQNLQGHWERVADMTIVFLVFLLAVYSIGCCALWSNRGNRRSYTVTSKSEVELTV